MTHLHISVPAITRGTLARTHELKKNLHLRKLSNSRKTEACFASYTWVFFRILAELPHLEKEDLNLTILVDTWSVTYFLSQCASEGFEGNVGGIN